MPQFVEKKVKLEYFRVVCTSIDDIHKSGVKDVLFDLNKWISIFDGMLSNISNRVKKYNGENVRLDEFLAYGKDMWILRFIRMRDSNLPKKAYRNKNTEDMELETDEYIGEEVIAIYDDSINVLALQRNRNSLSVTGIEKYMNEVWMHNDGNIIHLRPILSNVNFNDFISNPNAQYKKIVFKIADTEDISENTYNNSSIGNILNIARNHKGNCVEVTISNGRSRNKRLSNTVVTSTLAELSENKDILKKAEVYCAKDENEDSFEFVDLLSDKLYDYVLIQYEPKKSVSSDYLSKKLIEQYNLSKDKIKNALKIK